MTFNESLNADYDVKLNTVRREVRNVCIRAKLISSEDIDRKTKKYYWLDEVIGRNLVGLGLLNQLLLEFAEVPEELEPTKLEVDEMISSVIKSIVQQVLNELPQVPALS